jgi:hypothetical protein
MDTRPKISRKDAIDMLDSLRLKIRTAREQANLLRDSLPEGKADGLYHVTLQFDSVLDKVDLLTYRTKEDRW